MPNVVAPCLVIQGTDDEYGTVRQVEAIVGGVSGPARPLLVPDCRHVPHLQAGDRVLPAITNFISEHCR
ncbi:MAG TPA: alpha/beta hydrolase [Chromatiales bacterium]|nr:alpha/beta hydrolase [Chromatiales bacterium]